MPELTSGQTLEVSQGPAQDLSRIRLEEDKTAPRVSRTSPQPLQGSGHLPVPSLPAGQRRGAAR